MDKLLNNPIIIGGALLGAYFILRKQPNYQESKTGRAVTRLGDYGRSVVDSVVDTGTEVIGGLYETGQDIWGIYDNDDVPDIDNGLPGADEAINLGMDDAENQEAQDVGMDAVGGMAEDTEETNPDGGGFDGGRSRMSRGFDGSTMDYNMSF